MPSLSTVFKSLHSSHFCQLLSSSDDQICRLAKWKANRDINSSHYKFRVSSSAVVIVDSSEVKNLQKSKKSVKSQVEKGDIQKHLEHMKSCSVQRSMYCLPSMSGERIWSKVVSNLNDRVAAFIISAVQGVLPHKVNLMRWNKMNSRECPLCK